VNISCFSPTKKTAQLEGSKAFAKDFMQRHPIPTGRYQNFTDYDAACAHVRSINYDVVIKPAGLAAGEGVIIPETTAEALDALKTIMVDKSLGAAGSEVVVEEYLQGYELSILTFCDGTNFQSLPPAQDHKRIYDGNKGPNTGGMGAYASVGFADLELLKEIDNSIIEPTFAALRLEGKQQS
jgi:phosphoribosylamine--glycine ligase / phosphoribosylformylglycinamidine cyclo-ligase